MPSTFVFIGGSIDLFDQPDSFNKSKSFDKSKRFDKSNSFDIVKVFDVTSSFDLMKPSYGSNYIIWTHNIQLMYHIRPSKIRLDAINFEITSSNFDIPISINYLPYVTLRAKRGPYCDYVDQSNPLDYVGNQYGDYDITFDATHVSSYLMKIEVVW